MLPKITIRLARCSDGDRLVELCQQLGYTVSPEQLQRRLAGLQQADRDHVVYVAESPEGVIGWIHLYLCQTLVAERMGVIGGLVVDARWRQQGIGPLLIRHAEGWALAQGCQEMVVRSNVVRQAAHRFYARNEFVEMKRSVVFHKRLDPDSSAD
jgi:GNAT superfamily N-acetyltransferase